MSIHNSKDNSFKLILANHQLFVQFLRDYIPIDLLKTVGPEDIEDISERFLPLFQDNRDSDTVKRINLKGETPLFVITIVEHESRVNYRAPFKMLQYITLVLDNYEKEANREHPGLSATRDFRYPPVLPVIFYDGTTPWSAARNLADRTTLREVFFPYIPRFEYELVDLNHYSFEDLTRFQNVLSILMIIDKVGPGDDTELLGKLRDYIQEAGLKIPPNLTKLITDVITVLLHRAQVPAEEIGALTDLLDKKGEQKMFDSFVEAVIEGRRVAKEEGIQIGTEKGIQIGVEQSRGIAYREKLESARRFTARGYPAEEVAEILGLDPDVVRGLV
jgi:hypothetical protein